MIAKHKLVALALLVATVVVAPSADALAQCTTCAVPTVAYRPVATTAYSPVAYTTYSGWYPGYWLGRVNRAIWGSPTYTVAYPATYTAGYATTAYYAPSYSYATSYAPAYSSASACTTCYAPSCSTCSVQQVVMRPVCATACDPCAACPTCPTATQAVYQEPAACVGCAPATTTTSAPSGSYNSQPPPTLAPTEEPPREREYREKPASDDDSTVLEPEPAAESADESASTFDAPRLLPPNDLTAKRHAAPVWTAVYHKQIAGARTQAVFVSRQQAERDAAGWTSASQ